jgi:CRISPR-associated protein Cas5h
VSQESLGTWVSEGANQGQRCLSFTLSGPWGHFRRVEGNIVKQTYRIIPRTTVAGLVAGMLGIGRDQYYGLFAPKESSIAVEPVTKLRTINMPQNTLSTADEHINRVPPRSRTLKIGLPDPTELRQQHNYEVLVEPAYRIDLWLSHEETFKRVREVLENGESHYVPSLGLSEHLAEVEYHGEFEIESGPDGEEIDVDSTVPEAVDSIVPRTGESYGIERSPAFMEASNGGRTTTGFVAHAYSPAGESLRARGVSINRVDGRTVMFV